MAGASAALLFATKETAFISAGVLIIAFAITLYYVPLHRKIFGPATPKRKKGRTSTTRLNTVLNEMGGKTTVVVAAILAVITFRGGLPAFLFIVLSEPQRHRRLVPDLCYLEKDRRRGTRPSLVSVHHMADEAGGRSVVSWRSRRGIGCFDTQKTARSLLRVVVVWSDRRIFNYRLQDPWLLLNFVVPLAVIAGYGIQAVYELDRGQLRLVSAMLFVAITVGLYQCIDLNFINYDNDKPKYVYVYAHTTRATLDLVNEIERIAKEESGPTTGMSIISPDYWPLPWYLRGYSRVGYYGRMAATTEPIIIANANQEVEVEANFGERYEQVPSKDPDETFQLRPGVNLLLYRRRR